MNGATFRNSVAMGALAGAAAGTVVALAGEKISGEKIAAVAVAVAVT